MSEDQSPPKLRPIRWGKQHLGSCLSRKGWSAPPPKIRSGPPTAGRKHPDGAQDQR